MPISTRVRPPSPSPTGFRPPVQTPAAAPEPDFVPAVVPAAVPTAAPAAGAAPVPVQSGVDWSKEDAAITAKRALGDQNAPSDLTAQRYCHQQAEALCQFLHGESFQQELRGTLLSSSLIASGAVDARVQQFVGDAEAQIRDRSLKSYYQVSLSRPESLKAAMLKFAATNITPNHRSEQGYITPRYDKETRTMTAVATPGIKGQVDLLKRTFPPDKTGFSIEAVAVRQADFYKVRRGSNPGIDHEPNINFDFTPEGQVPKDTPPKEVAAARSRLNPIIGAYCIIRLNNCPDFIVAYTRQQIETISGPLGGNTYYAKTPAKEAENCVKREALRGFTSTRTIAPELAAMESMLNDTYKEGDEPTEAAKNLEAARQAQAGARVAIRSEAPITPTTARPGAPISAPAPRPASQATASVRPVQPHPSPAPAQPAAPAPANAATVAFGNLRAAQQTQADQDLASSEQEEDEEGLGHDPAEGMEEYAEEAVGGPRM